jgi:hypothetical protein
MTDSDNHSSAATGYADLVRELHQAAEEYDRGHGVLHAAAANAIQHLETLLQSRGAAQQPGMREALEQIEAIADRPISGTSLQTKANRFDQIKAKARAALAAQPPAAPVEKSGIMQAAAKAAEKVASWSPSKRDYANRVVGGECSSAGNASARELLKRLWSQIYDKRPAGDPKDTYRELAALLDEPQTAQDPLAIIEDSCWDIRCRDVPTGGDDYDIVWDIIEHYQAAPKERVVGTGRSPREALADATSALSRPHQPTPSAPGASTPDQRPRE